MENLRRPWLVQCILARSRWGEKGEEEEEEEEEEEDREW
jgi:hypothetical protein